jgi:hypothetical protein
VSKLFAEHKIKTPRTANSSIKIISLSAFNLSVFVPKMTIRVVIKVTNFSPVAKLSILK